MTHVQEYADEQMQLREHKARPMLESIVDKLQKVLEKVCKEVQKQARLYQESVRDQTELEDTTGVELIQAGAGQGGGGGGVELRWELGRGEGGVFVTHPGGCWAWGVFF